MEAGLKDKVVGDRYRVLDLLGEGAMGAVYLARDLQLPRQVALKVMRKEWVTRPDVRQRLENECGMMAHMGPHNHIVTLYDRIEFEGDVILVMEYVPGETLADILDRTRALNNDTESSRKTTPVAAGTSIMVLEPRDAVEVAAQCLDALAFAHSKEVIHRDIKPSNIIVMRDHVGNLAAKVMDFGIGKVIGGTEDMQPGPMLTAVGGPGPGTPAYMAPEQIDPARFGTAGPGADLYAMGVTLYEMLTFSRPFEGTFTELLHAHTAIEPPNPRKANPAVSQDLERVLARALKKKPAERYQSAGEFKMDLMACRGGGGTMMGNAGQWAPRDYSQQDGDNGAKRSILLPVTAALLLVLMAAAGVGYYYPLRSKEASEPVPSAMPAPVTPIVPEPVLPDESGQGTPVMPGPNPSEEAIKAEQERVAAEAETARKEAEARWAEQKAQEEREATQKAEEARKVEEAKRAEEAKRKADAERAAQRAQEEARRVQENNPQTKTPVKSNPTDPASSSTVPDWARDVTVKSDSVVHK